MDIIAQPFGYLLKILYDLFNNYGWAIIAFTFIVNLIQLPLTIKQQKSTAAMQRMQPQIAAIQAEYANDKDKQSQELMKMYQEHGINPMGGCLPTIIQLAFVLILYQVIIKPLTHMYGLSGDLVNQLSTLVGIEPGPGVQQINIIQGMTDSIRSMPEFAHIPHINFNFYGMDLALRPQWQVPSLLWIIPVMAAVTSFLLTRMTQMQMKAPAADNPTAASLNSMTKIMPLMTAFFTFSFPAGIGLYWVVSNIARMIQQYFINLLNKRSSDEDPLVIEKKVTVPRNTKKKKKKK